MMYVYRRRPAPDGSVAIEELGLIDTLDEVVITARRLVAPIAANVMPRPIRNNNPMALRRTSIPWKGKVATPERAAELGLRWDAGYEQFEHEQWGVRAGARDLRNDFHKDGKRTVRALITEYAPHSENPTDAYVANVAKALGVNADAVFDLEAQLVDMVAAIIRQENGIQPYTRAQLAEWVNLA